MQLLAKFKKILYMGFRATLNFRKFKVALNPMYRVCLNEVNITDGLVQMSVAFTCTPTNLTSFIQHVCDWLGNPQVKGIHSGGHNNTKKSLQRNIKARQPSLDALHPA